MRDNAFMQTIILISINEIEIEDETDMDSIQNKDGGVTPHAPRKKNNNIFARRTIYLRNQYRPLVGWRAVQRATIATTTASSSQMGLLFGQFLRPVLSAISWYNKHLKVTCLEFLAVRPAASRWSDLYIVLLASSTAAAIQRWCPRVHDFVVFAFWGLM